MKLLFLAALVASGACFRWWSTEDDTGPNTITQNKKFTSGNEYVYKYESQVLTGIPSLSKQYSGIKIVSKVKIAFVSSSDATLQLDEVQVYSMNHEIQDPHKLPVHQQISTDQFAPLPSEQSRLVVERLQKPIKFRYQSGKVEQVQICNEESNWSVDLKRSILNMLQVRLQASDFTVTPNLEYNNLERENSTTFDVLEKGLDGECYSSHHVQQSQNETSRFQVVKSRDEERCLSLNRQRKDVMPHQQRNCQCEDNLNQKNCECQPEEAERSEREETEIRTLYDIVSENRQDILIHKAVQSVQYRHQAPYTPNQYVLTTSNQTLRLIEEREQQTVSTSGLTFQTVDQPWKQQILSQSEEKPMLSEQQLLQLIRDTLSEMVTISSDSQRYEDHPAVFYQLISHLRMCSKSQLNTLYNEAKGNDNDNSSNNKKWKILIDGMSYANTTVCDKLLLTKIVNNDIKNQEASSLLAVWASDKVPTPTILDYMLNTVLPTLQSKPNKRVVYKHAMLCFGSMTRRYIDQEQRRQSEAVQESQKTIHQSNIDDCRKYEKYVESRLNSASNENDKILCLKTVSNMGNIKALPLVQKHLQRSEPKAVRVQAVWAFQRFGQQNQIQTLQSLLPIMNHQQEDSEVRIAAFAMVMKCDPSSSLLAVQKQLNQENDLEFKTFVVRYLKNYLHRREPGYQQRNSKIRSVLRQVQAFKLSELTTDFEIPMGLNGDEKNGDIIRFSFLSNQTSRFSRAGAFQQLAMTNGVRRHIAEIGYRTEGLEQIIKKFIEEGSSPVNSHPDLRSLDKLRDQKNKEQVKPSVTIYAKFMGQEVSFVHYDENAINDMIAEGLRNNNNGYVDLKLQYFQTIYFKPYQLKKLQPNGVWQIDENLYSGVLDVDGVLRIRMVKGELPSIRFETTKPVRKEFKTIRAQYVNTGFASCGVSGAMGVRRTINSANLTVSYFPQENKFVMNHTQPQQNNDLATQEYRAYTKSFVLPQRLPQVVKSKDQCFKTLKTDDSQRQQFTHQIESMRSVELDAKIECDVEMPQLYSFVRERLHLIPTSLSSHNQLVKISVKPDTSAQRNYTFSFGARFFNSSELEQLEAQNWGEQEQRHRQSQQQKKYSIFDYMWSKQSNQQQQQQQNQPQSFSTQQFLKSDSLGSLYYFQHFTLSSESHMRVLNMTGNMTTYYEHDFPTTRTLTRFQRPPVPSSQEREPVEFTDKMVSTVNPGNNEFVWAHNMSWGEISQSQRPNMTWTIRLTPEYKDGVCYSQTVEGCRDAYGVVYPAKYNVSQQFNYNNTDVVEKFFNSTRPYLYNFAQSIFNTPVFRTPEHVQQLNPQHGRYNVSQTIKPSSNRFDMKLPLNPRNPVCIEMNATNIYSPLEVKFWQWMSQNQYPVSEIKPIHDYLPIHHRTSPFDRKRDICIIQAPRSYTFDKKEIAMPQTDCEVILVGDCRSSNKQVMVTIKPATNQGRSAERELKAVVGGQKIQILFTPKVAFGSQQMKVKVNDVEKTLDENNQLTVVESRQPVAVVQCDQIKCEILSQKHGIYVSMDSERVAVEVDSEKSQEMCGLCSFTPQKPQKPTVADSMNLWKENKAGGSCSLQEPSRQQLQDTCNREYKHKVKSTVDQNGRLMTCVSVNRLPVCNTRCNQKSIETSQEQFRCISRQHAQQLEVTPRIQGEDLILEDGQILKRFQNSQQIQSNVNIAQSCLN